MGAWSRQPMGTAKREKRLARLACGRFTEALMSVTIQPDARTTEHDPAIPDVPIYRLTVAQYHAMAEAGILTEDDPVELLEGWLVQKMTKYPPMFLPRASETPSHPPSRSCRLRSSLR